MMWIADSTLSKEFEFVWRCHVVRAGHFIDCIAPVSKNTIPKIWHKEHHILIFRDKFLKIIFLRIVNLPWFLEVDKLPLCATSQIAQCCDLAAWFSM
jgi:hypothetical protein